LISIDRLQAICDLLDHIDVDELETKALTQATHDIQALVEASETDAATASISSRLVPGGVVIGSTNPHAAEREFGSMDHQPEPLLGAAASEIGPVVAERIGQVFARRLAGR
jgi:hypothetical protein